MVKGAGFDLKSLVRPNIWGLQPYRCARDDYDSGILLDANENSFGSAITNEQFNELERYPDPYQIPLKEKIANYRGVKKENVFLGVGSDEAIDILIRIFCTPGKESILTLPPTYGMYKVSAATNDIKVISVPLTPSFQIELDKVQQAVDSDDSIKMIFICSPNNPTANDILSTDMETIIKNFSNKIVIVDEAYIDFSDKPSLTPLVDKYPNLVVLQTLSKAFGLAGIRLGMAISQPEIIQIMSKVKAPYNINKMTSQLALSAFEKENLERVKKNIALIKQERTRVISGLKNVTLVRKIHPTSANFVLFQIDNSFAIYKKMADLGVVIRYRGTEIHCEDCLRMTIGTPEQNDEFVKRLNEAIASN